MKSNTFYAFLNVALSAAAMTHPGLLHTEDDFTRIRTLIDDKTEPQLTGWNKLTARADASYTPSATETICRGDSCDPQNYPTLYRDIAAAYANAVYWKVTGEEANGDAAASILDAWSSTLTNLEGNADRFLAAGIYGYQLANAAEILRGYEKWDGLDAVVELLEAIFLPMNLDFLANHNDAVIDNYWANWDLCNLAALHAIGVLSDNQTAIDQAVTYFKEGEGMGALTNMIWTVHEEEGTGKSLGQGQEAGRDQGHSLLDFGLLGVLAQQAYNQGEDLFALEDNLILAGAEYVFKYNSGNDVPFSTYTNSHGTATEISSSGRGTMRPIAELLYAHYNGVKGLDASWTGAYRDLVVEDGDGAEGGGGDYGTTSGGYDALGFGTALFRLD
ncbi:chondroitin AC/alginate lyase [Aspergillus cavernicola]|uniref:Chondroitin AC/alginate lyase n=1 Tax=Aspergillus cavernicola TaxID=176166 RepID=A0ABR4HU00_9EURO